MQIIWGIFGVLFLLGLAFLLSKDKKAINVRTIAGALIIQVVFAFIVLKWETGKNILGSVAAFVQRIIDSSNEGMQFIFGGLFEAEGIGFVFAFQVLTIIIFFSSLISVLFYLVLCNF